MSSDWAVFPILPPALGLAGCLCEARAPLLSTGMLVLMLSMARPQAKGLVCVTTLVCLPHMGGLIIPAPHRRKLNRSAVGAPTL